MVYLTRRPGAVMAKGILMSILLVTIAAPVLAARERSARRGFTHLVLVMFLFSIVYVLLVTQVYAKYWVPEVW